MPVNSDTFTNSNGTALATHNSDWNILSGTFEIQNNECEPVQDANGFAQYSGSYGNDQYSQGTRPVITPGSNKRAGFAVRLQSGISCYHCQLRDSGTKRRLYLLDAGSYTQLDSDTVTPSTTATYKIEATGSAITVDEDVTEILSATNSTVASGGTPGLFGRDTASNHRIDNFEGGDIGGGGGGGIVILRRRINQS